MTIATHPLATAHLPIFATAPGHADVLMKVMGVFLVVMTVLAGIMFLTLHTLPERMAHKSQKLQFEVVAVLGLLSLFTHEHIFWVAGLLLAFVDLPDFSTPIASMASSLHRMANAAGSGGSQDQLSAEPSGPAPGPGAWGDVNGGSGMGPVGAAPDQAGSPQHKV